MSTAFHTHDHIQCITSALTAAEATCAEKGLRMTPIRRQVFSILLEAHQAMGAYEVLEKLGSGAAPPVAYRALAFLTEHGFAHRIERLNAYVACAEPGSDHAPAFLICRDCNLVAEAQTDSPVAASARAAGFAVEQVVIEAEGLCPSCQEKTPA